MKKLRWPACLLSLLLLVGSLPATAFAEQPDDAVGDQKNGAATVYVGGQAMTAGASAESWYADGQVVASEPASYSAHLYLDAANNGALTLEIRDLTVSGTEDDAASRGAGIYTTQALTIRYSGENTVTASTAFDYDAAPGVSFRSYDISYGIFAGGLVLIGGNRRQPERDGGGCERQQLRHLLRRRPHRAGRDHPLPGGKHH